MSDIQRTEAALAKVVAWAEAHPDLSWKEGVKNALDTLTEEMATLERELNEALVQERDRLLRDLEIMVRRADNEERAMERAEKAESALAECMKHADAMAKELDIVGEAANLATYSDLAFREWRAKQ